MTTWTGTWFGAFSLDGGNNLSNNFRIDGSYSGAAQLGKTTFQIPFVAGAGISAALNTNGDRITDFLDLSKNR
jgi:hypothetical protein